MNSVEDLLEGYRRFRKGVYADQAALYRELGEGQNPDIMLIGCADSRADPSDIFNAAPGQLFVVRNVANLVPPYQPDQGLHGVSAALISLLFKNRLRATDDDGRPHFGPVSLSSPWRWPSARRPFSRAPSAPSSPSRPSRSPSARPGIS